MTRVMITNGNNFHPADFHAEVTAEKIVVVGEHAPADLVNASRAFRKAVEAILVKHHTDVENAEQSALAEHGAARYDHPLIAVVDAAILKEIVSASYKEGHGLAAHFERADVQAAIMQELEHETRSQMNVHRDVHKAAARLAAV